jgi:hypothetical protein
LNGRGRIVVWYVVTDVWGDKIRRPQIFFGHGEAGHVGEWDGGG